MLPVRKAPRQHGTPRERSDYRAWKRNNAIKWHGVKPTLKKDYPPLVPSISKRGETHYVELW